ncbi:MAG: three-Cys-motif partner protein TcmP [Planctomycetota bacterium]
MLNPAAPSEDGLITPTVGRWSRDKHHFLLRYIDAFTTAMRTKGWSGLHYIDLFAGAGIEKLEGSGELEWGSPLIAAQAMPPFDRLHLCELANEKFDALCQRIPRFRTHSTDQLLSGDANRKVNDIVQAIPSRALCLAFLDPYGLHLDYATLRLLARIRSDLIIFFPDRLDIDRNWKAYYWGNPESNLDAVLGADSNWRQVVLRASDSRRRQAFLELYRNQIAKLGYRHFEWEPIPSEGMRLYWLIYCSRSSVGARIWRGVSEKKRSGQRSLGFPPSG